MCVCVCVFVLAAASAEKAGWSASSCGNTSLIQLILGQTLNSVPNKHWTKSRLVSKLMWQHKPDTFDTKSNTLFRTKKTLDKKLQLQHVTENLVHMQPMQQLSTFTFTHLMDCCCCCCCC